MTQPQQPQLPQPDFRASLMKAVAVAQQQPDMAAVVYQNLGLNVPNVKTTGYRAPVGELKPGDLIGWHGGSNNADGTYAGNVAVYAGNGEIIEKFFGNTRRRQLNHNDNVFGMPVVMPDDAPPEQGNAP